MLTSICIGVAGTLGLAASPQLAQSHNATAEPAPIAAKPSKCEGTKTSGTNAPMPADPYPLNAAGWGPEAGNGRLFSRWAEDWTGMRAAGNAPDLKAMSLGGDASLTLSAEARLRFDSFDNARSARGNDYEQTLLRGVLGADLRFNPNVRIYGEIATGQVAGSRNDAAANFQNDASLQQLFVDVRRHVGSVLVGVMLGRQEFADGPNIHRTWNGARLYVHGARARAGGFTLRATPQERGTFDEGINDAKRLQGLNASSIVSPKGSPNIYLEHFWIHSEKPGFRVGSEIGLDVRDTLGARLWGRRERFRSHG